MRGRAKRKIRNFPAARTLRVRADTARRGVSVGYGRMGRMSEHPTGDALPEYAERVLDVAELIPPGRVMTYGDVAEWLEEGGPRQVGRAMALYGSAVPWWRVVRSDGKLLPGHELRALDHYRAESTPLREVPASAEGHLPRLDMRRARWDGVTGGPAEAAGGGGGAHT
ncbi:Alkylated DNA nucleotide flippase Atl1, participates in nucleotide excision repair, Ada-like DNA-binding domain [Streptomyces sp. 2131.1]|nr:Alkylated DNA nucleotide flippase Atl1, participates in nucleotide excision repair, Ada-like DNA-binding domain [Streptomyces sp. 2131.1]